MKKIGLLTVVFCISVLSYGKILLPGIFTDNMVLQQNSDVAIWGWGNSSEVVKIVGSWNTADTVLTKADNAARWRASIKTTKAGGPYTLTILGTSKVVLQNVMLGEVWLCSGQSNMEWSVNHQNVMNGEQEAAAANHPNIRFFHVPKIGSDTPQDDCKAAWAVCSPETMRATSVVGYFFGRALQQNLDVPVGLIVSAWGGTPAEVWVEKEWIEQNTLLNSKKYDDVYDWWPNKPGTLYNSMIAPLIPYKIAGAIWYQGESNRKYPDHYAQLMKTMVENWRADFGREFPFYFVQIAPFQYGPDGKSWIIREQQELASKIIPKSGMVVVADLVDDIKNIHPANKLDVGRRLAGFALAEVYGKNMGEYKSPFYKSMNIEKDKVRISLNNTGTGLKSNSKKPINFFIAGEDRQFISADVKIEGHSIFVSSKSVKNPVAVRYCFNDTSMPDVFNSAGLPLAPFRTDDWSE